MHLLLYKHTHTHWLMPKPITHIQLVLLKWLSCLFLLAFLHTHRLTRAHTHTHTHWLILDKTSWSSSTDSLACFCSLSFTHAYIFSLSHTHWLMPHKPINTASPQPVLLLVYACFFHHDNTHAHTHTHTQTLPLSHKHTHTDSCHTNPSNPASSQPALLVSAHFFYHAHTHIHPCHTNPASLPRLTLWPVWVVRQHWQQCLGLCPDSWSASCVGRATATGPVWSCGPVQALFQTHRGWRSSAPWAETNT